MTCVTQAPAYTTDDNFNVITITFTSGIKQVEDRNWHSEIVNSLSQEKNTTEHVCIILLNKTKTVIQNGTYSTCGTSKVAYNSNILQEGKFLKNTKQIPVQFELPLKL